MAHSDLIARLEKAESGSRELDWRLAKVFAVPDASTWPDIEMWPPFMPGSKTDKAIPAYTTSLDAIVSLIREKSPLRGPVSIEMAGSGFCAINHVEPCKDGVGAWGNTPPLACCIALLKALSQGGEHGS